jgi:hypothetical protein
MTVRVRSEKAGYLYLLYLQADGKSVLLFPNQHHEDARIPAGQTVEVPGPDSAFRLRIGDPTGKEMLKAIVSEQPLKAQEIERAKTQDVTPLSNAQVRSVFVEEVKRQNARWAEHQVEVTTLPKEGGMPQSQHKRLAVCIGISDFQSDDISDLSVCHTDAIAMSEVLKDRCGFQGALVLTNENATRENIEKAIRGLLVTETQPGDEIVIFWSGHGARIADDNGDEPDGQDEVLIPWDAQVDSIENIKRTLITDDAFGRWIQELDGRRVLVVLDTCHSGGQATQEKKTRTKSLLLKNGTGKGLLNLAAPAKLDFFDGEFARVKDIGQQGAALLASSMARETSLERSEGDLSVMTYFMIDHIRNASGKVTPKTIFTDLSRRVPEYVQKVNPGSSQTPFLVDDIKPEFVLK